MKQHFSDTQPTSFLQGQELDVLSLYVSSYIGALSFNNVQLSEINTRYIEGGKGTPLILLHGLGANKSYFRSIMKALAADYHVIAPDVPGLYPNARFASGKHNFRRISNWLKEFTDTLGIKKYHLLGNSLGASIAAHHAYHHPDQIINLSLLSLPESFNRSGENIRTVIENALQTLSSIDELEELIAYCFYRPPNMPTVIKKKFLKDALAHKAFYLKLFEDVKEGQSQLLPKLRGIKAPTLLLSGDSDPVCSVEFSQSIERQIPNSEAHILANSKHMTFLERHRLVVHLLQEFLPENSAAKLA